MARETSFLAHSSFHFEDLQLSSMDFYQTLEERISSFEFPNVTMSRVKFAEGGILSSSREYLCVHRNEHYFYICATPFGRSFLVSYWLKETMSIGSALLACIPFIGNRLAENNEKKTFYQLDTTELFKASIKKIVDGLVHELTENKGLRKPNPVQEPALN